MNRLCWIFTVLIVACGDEGADDGSFDAAQREDAATDPLDASQQTAEPTKDAAEPVLNPDAGRPVRVHNVGAACGASQRCEGGMSMCLPRLAAGLELPGGYCSAICELSSDCGARGHCVRAEAEEALAQGPGAAFVPSFPQSCLQTCSDTSDCRSAEGYECVSVLALFPQQVRDAVSAAIDASALAPTRYCLPK